MSLWRVKRTCLFALHMSAYDPKRTSTGFLFAVVPNIGGEFPFTLDPLPHHEIFP